MCPVRCTITCFGTLSIKIDYGVNFVLGFLNVKQGGGPSFFLTNRLKFIVYINRIMQIDKHKAKQ